MTLKLRPIKRKYRTTQNTSTAHLVQGSPVSKTDVLHLVEYERLISDDDRRNKMWKPVTHEKFSVELLDPASYISWDDENAFKKGKLKATGTSWFVLDVLDTIGKKSKEAAFAWMADNPVDWDKVARTLVPDLRNEFNTINFLLELDDIPKMGKNLIDRKTPSVSTFLKKSYVVGPRSKRLAPA